MTVPWKFACYACRMVFRKTGFSGNETTRCHCGIRFDQIKRTPDAVIILRADLNDRRTHERIGGPTL